MTSVPPPAPHGTISFAVPQGILGAAEAPVNDKANKAAPAKLALNKFLIGIVISTNLFILFLMIINFYILLVL